MEFDYSLYPGRQRKIVEFEDKEIEPVVTIITAYYNGHKYIDETINSVLNQTFPAWEWIIVNDGSTDEESIKKLEEIKKIDSRIKVLNKKNSGPAESRDFGVKNSSKNSKYLVFLDSDDLLNNTYLECAYISLETNKEASWAYTDTVNFGEQESLWQKSFNVEIEKKDNLLVLTSMIRKNDFMEVNGFDVKEVNFFEDWYLWIKLLKKGKYPIRLNSLSFWYRKKKAEESKLSRDLLNLKEIIKKIQKETNNIPKNIEAIQYPKQDFNWDMLRELEIGCYKVKKNQKKKILMIIPWMALGGADKFNLDVIKGLKEKNYEFIIISTEPNINVWRQTFEEVSTVYDLTTFIDRKYWASFINYIIKKENIDLILNTNSTFGYAALPYIKASNSNIPIIDYIHMEEWYNRNGGFSRDTANLESILEKTLVCNDNSRKILINYFGRSEEKTETVYIGVDSERFNPEEFDKEEILKKYKIDDKNKKIIGFIARIDLQKRPYLLMKVIRKLREERNDFLLVIAGDGPLLSEIKKVSKKYELDKDIKFLGAMSNTKEFYVMCDITLNCSIKEGLALTSYESLSMGVPVISSNVGGQAELINEKVGAIVPCLQEEKEILNYKYSEEEIINYVKAIDKVLNNLNYYKKNARKHILNNFTIEKMIEKMNIILSNSIERHNADKFKDLEKYKNLFKENIEKYLMLYAKEYNWLSNEFNKNIFGEEIASVSSKSVKTNENNEIMTKTNKIAAITVKLHIYKESKIIYKILKEMKEVVILIGKLFKQVFARFAHLLGFRREK